MENDMLKLTSLTQFLPFNGNQISHSFIQISLYLQRSDVIDTFEMNVLPEETLIFYMFVKRSYFHIIIYALVPFSFIYHNMALQAFIQHRLHTMHINYPVFCLKTSQRTFTVSFLHSSKYNRCIIHNLLISRFNFSCEYFDWKF